MKALFRLIKKQRLFTHEIADKRQEVLIKQGRIEFKWLIEKGLSIPVVLL